tara:strand:- start:152 stop:469 length:318 start_codon:yes stop_codon:yes gene_type:complete
MSKFQITNHKGFRMGFKNGFEISVQWGPGNYCERKDEDFDKPQEERFWESRTAEIAIFDSKDDSMITLGKDNVDGWLTPDKVAKVITMVSLAKTKNEITEKYKTI